MLSPNIILQNRYRVVRKLGEGGMGAIYEAVDQRVSCVVALKETLVVNNEARQAFQREAALLANLRHSSLPKVMDYFSESDGEFLVMEYIAGHDLAELLELRSGPFPLAQALEWAEHLLRLLEYLHSREPPIVHRDIKPSNLKVTSEGEIFLLDFGLAKGAAGEMTSTGRDKSVFGYTPVYAPIEQIHGSGTDPRSDIYSLGATLYDLLTGQPPVPASTRFEAVETDRPDPLTPINELNVAVPAAVAAIIQRAMALSRRDRFASASEMRQALGAFDQSALNREEQARRAEAALLETLPAHPSEAGKPLYVDKNVQFTVYSPKRIKPKKIYSLLAFAHLSRKRADDAEDEPDPVEEMRQQAARILGDQRGDYEDTRRPGAQAVPHGGELRFVPVVQGLNFSPPSRAFNWHKSVHREEFDLWASAEVDGQSLKGQMTVFLGALVIAEVPLEITVDSTAVPAMEKISLDEPQTARRLRQIFASYSPRDEQVVAELGQVAPIFGSQFITDRTHLMPGEDRTEGTRRLISGADAFQLFWSSNSMRSPDVMNEIDYAISLNKKNFILPTYWEDPLPKSPQEKLPPEELERLHFFRIYPGSILQTMNAATGGSRSTKPAFASPTASASPDASSSPTVDGGGGDSPNYPTAAIVQCTKCGARFAEGITVCGRCGGPSFEPLTSSSPGVAPTAAIVQCTRCKATFAEGIRFCGRCGGTSFEPVTSHQAVTQFQPAGALAPAPTMMSQPMKITAPPKTQMSTAASTSAPLPGSAVKRKLPKLPIYAGAAIVLFALIAAPVWLFQSASYKSSAPTVTSPNAPPKTFTNSVGIELMYIPSGTFLMGSTDTSDDGGKPPHQVTITQAFYLAKYEVTQEQWQAVMGNNPSHYKGNKLPVEQVSWNDAIAFIAKLNARNDGFTYRLPTEAEWEYAARAGTTSTYFWGNDQTQACRYANVGDQTGTQKYPGAELIACRDGYADSSPVGSFQPNNFGLYDMTGNVAEWCQDWYDANYYRSSPGSDPQGPASGDSRVLRGGAFGSATWWLGSAVRFQSSPDAVASNFGFRVAAVARTR